MMSDKVIKTDAFMEMPHSTKTLYFYLMIDADDDGFVANPKTIMRMIGAAEDDYKILVAKKFLIPFQSGVCVIKHWLIHNLIRADRKIDTQWVEERGLLEIDEETRKYSLKEGLQPNDNQVTTKCPHRLGKVSVGKDRLGKENEDILPVSRLGEYQNVKLTQEQLGSLIQSLGESPTQALITELDQYIASKGKDPYKDHSAVIKQWYRRRVQEHASKFLPGKPKMI